MDLSSLVYRAAQHLLPAILVPLAMSAFLLWCLRGALRNLRLVRGARRALEFWLSSRQKL